MTNADLLRHVSRFTFGTDECPVHVERRKQRDGTTKWVVLFRSSVLNKNDELEFEPQPSSRTDEFLARTRFLRRDAIAKAQKLVKRIEER